MQAACLYSGAYGFLVDNQVFVWASVACKGGLCHGTRSGHIAVRYVLGGRLFLANAVIKLIVPALSCWVLKSATMPTHSRLLALGCTL